MRAALGEVWPELTHWFGLRPADLYLTPEDGGYTYGEWGEYLDAVAEVPPPGSVFLVTRKE
jgi:hypothetical protein